MDLFVAMAMVWVSLSKDALSSASFLKDFLVNLFGNMIVTILIREIVNEYNFKKKCQKEDLYVLS